VLTIATALSPFDREQNWPRAVDPNPKTLAKTSPTLYKRLLREAINFA
jgi:hypothetical protein